MAKKIVLTLVVIFLVFFMVSQPEDAAAGTRRILNGIGWVFNGIVRFFQSLA